MQKLTSKNLLFFNLILIGVIFGGFLAFFSFFRNDSETRNIAYAQEITPIEIPLSAFASAEALQRTLNAVTERVLPSVVEIRTVLTAPQRFHGIPHDASGMGSGVIVRRNRNVFYVLTNNHVIGGATRIVIAVKGGAEYPGEVVGRDSRRDLAIVSFRSTGNFPVAELGDSDNVKVGDWAIAVGNPLGQFAFSVTMGIVSAVGRSGGPGGNINDFIQTDASINQGNSGGPLINIRGEVIGINTWIAIAGPASGGNVGLGFAIPINNTKRAIDEFIAHGELSEGWLGVTLTDPDRMTAIDLGIIGKTGSLLVYLSLGSPADRGGIRVGDFFTHVDDRVVQGTNHLIQMISDIAPGQRAVFRIFRNGVSIDVSVILEDRRAQRASSNINLWPGISVHLLTDDIRSALRLDRDAQGLVVSQVIDGSPGAITGLRLGDRIIAVNDIPVNDLLSFFRVLGEETETELWFTFIRAGNTLNSARFIRER